jgi:hypothetical protein
MPEKVHPSSGIVVLEILLGGEVRLQRFGVAKTGAEEIVFAPQYVAGFLLQGPADGFQRGGDYVKVFDNQQSRHNQAKHGDRQG